MLTKSELETLSSILLLELHLRIWGLFFFFKKKMPVLFLLHAVYFGDGEKQLIETRFRVAPSSTFTTRRAAAGTPGSRGRQIQLGSASLWLFLYSLRFQPTKSGYSQLNYPNQENPHRASKMRMSFIPRTQTVTEQKLLPQWSSDLGQEHMHVCTHARSSIAAHTAFNPCM